MVATYGKKSILEKYSIIVKEGLFGFKKDERKAIIYQEGAKKLTTDDEEIFLFSELNYAPLDFSKKL
jgi:hypothetical protein